MNTRLNVVLLCALSFLIAPAKSVTVQGVAVGIAGVAGTLTSLYVAAQLACGNSLSEIGSFFLEGLKHPTEIGTFSPCSKYLGRAVCARMPEATDRGHRYLEAGAGTGIVSEQILAKMGPNDHVVLAEFVPQLAQILREKFAAEIKAGRVSVVEGDVCAYQSAESFDYIFTTIPFNAFDAQTTKTIWNYFLKNLKPGGGVSYVNYRFFPQLRMIYQSKEKTRKLRGVMNFLDALHKKYGAGTMDVLRNVPPIRVRYFTFAAPERVNVFTSARKGLQAQAKVNVEESVPVDARAAIAA